MFRKKEPYTGGTFRIGGDYQTHADEVPEPSEESLPSSEIYLWPSAFANKIKRVFRVRDGSLSLAQP